MELYVGKWETVFRFPGGNRIMIVNNRKQKNHPLALLDTIMFDLDGTLLQFQQQEFIDVYLTELGKVFARLGMDPERSIKGVWAGTKAMLLNDGSMLNIERFWQAFSEYMGLTGERLRNVEAACDRFYSNEFNVAKAVMKPSEIPKRLVRKIASKGYDVVLATNPMFPQCAVESRLSWTGLEIQDFRLVTHYLNSTFCKPNLEYYREILTKIHKTPEQCLMVGNNPVEDMCAGWLGIETFLVTDYLENETGTDISAFRHGTLAELEVYLTSLPDK